LSESFWQTILNSDVWRHKVRMTTQNKLFLRFWSNVSISNV
jgi:hypothetical protein